MPTMPNPTPISGPFTASSVIAGAQGLDITADSNSMLALAQRGYGQGTRFNAARFGGYFDGNTHPAGPLYGNILTNIQADYPFAQSLYDEMDALAIQSAINAGVTRGMAEVFIPGTAVLTNSSTWPSGAGNYGITAVRVDNGGFGYTANFSVSDPGGFTGYAIVDYNANSSATIAPTVSGGVLTGGTIVKAGVNFQTGGWITVAVIGGGGSSGTLNLQINNGIVVGVSVGSPGSGYTSSPGNQIVSSGSVVKVLVKTPGSGYGNTGAGAAFSINFAGLGTGTGAVARAFPSGFCTLRLPVGKSNSSGVYVDIAGESKLTTVMVASNDCPAALLGIFAILECGQQWSSGAWNADDRRWGGANAQYEGYIKDLTLLGPLWNYTPSAGGKPLQAPQRTFTYAPVTTQYATGIAVGARRHLRNVRSSGWFSGVDLVGDQAEWIDVQLDYNFYGVYVSGPMNTGPLVGDFFWAGIKCSPCSWASIGVAGNTALSGVHASKCYFGTSPFSIYSERYATYRTSGPMLLNSQFDLCQFENFGNALLFEEPTNGSFHRVMENCHFNSEIQAATVPGTNNPYTCLSAIPAGGSRYSNAPVVTITDSTGSGATATAIVVNGVITGFNLVQGSGYSSTPTIAIIDGSGSGAHATVTGSGSSLSVQLGSLGNYGRWGVFITQSFSGRNTIEHFYPTVYSGAGPETYGSILGPASAPYISNGTQFPSFFAVAFVDGMEIDGNFDGPVQTTQEPGAFVLLGTCPLFGHQSGQGTQNVKLEHAGRWTAAIMQTMNAVSAGDVVESLQIANYKSWPVCQQSAVNANPVAGVALVGAASGQYVPVALPGSQNVPVKTSMAGGILLVKGASGAAVPTVPSASTVPAPGQIVGWVTFPTSASSVQAKLGS